MLECSAAEKKLLQPLFLMTSKPVLFVANVGDDDVGGTSGRVAELRANAEKTNAKVMH
jgi:ribosome-binding ATPase YchF (GTP1/OBG family)